MKNFFEINRALVAKKNFIMIIMAVALIALPTMAQQQEWKSTSTMQGTGSSYAPQVTSVGATAVSEMATTTETYSPAKAPGGPRKMGESGRNPGDVSTGSTESPIGDAVVPLLFLSLAFCGVIYLRRRKALSR